MGSEGGGGDDGGRDEVVVSLSLELVAFWGFQSVAASGIILHVGGGRRREGEGEGGGGGRRTCS